MRNRDRSFVTGLARGLLLIVGILGAFAALDGAVLFVYFLVAGFLIEAPGPYSGLLLVVLPFVSALGAALAWTAYVVWFDEVASPRDENREAHT